MSGYALHPEAFTDLNDIWEFIAEDNIDAADAVIADIFDAVRAPVAFPNQGHRRPDLTARPLRFVLVRDYLLAYAPDESPIVGDCRLGHGRRNPRVMAAILRGRE